MATSGTKDKRNKFSFWSKIFNIKFKKLAKMTDYELYLLTKETQEDFEKNSQKYRKLLSDRLKNEFCIPAAQGEENAIFNEITKLMAMPQDKLYYKVKEVKMKYEQKPIRLDDLPQLATLLLQTFPRTQENVDKILASKANSTNNCTPAPQRCERSLAQRCTRPAAPRCTRPTTTPKCTRAAAPRCTRSKTPLSTRPRARSSGSGCKKKITTVRRNSTPARSSRTTKQKKCRKKK